MDDNLKNNDNKYKKILDIDRKIDFIKKEIKKNKILYKKEDEIEMREFIKKEIEKDNIKKKFLKKRRKNLKKHDKKDIVILEIKMGVGGIESSYFINDLKKMYLKYIERKKWDKEIISENQIKNGGCKEVVIRVVGKKVYKNLKHESGVHRVQRSPRTESRGRIHTSTCRVAVYKNVEKKNNVIKNSELKIETFKSSGAGGQHVNKTNSAVRMIHKPTGTIIECQKERSQHKNKKHALSVLKIKIKDRENKITSEKLRNMKRVLLGDGNRVEKIRTYNYKENRITDHKFKFSLNNLEDIMQGDLEKVLKRVKKNVKKNKNNK